MAQALEAGTIGISEGIITNEVALFGGIKGSDYGREGSKCGLDDCERVEYRCAGGLAA